MHNAQSTKNSFVVVFFLLRFFRRHSKWYEIACSICTSVGRRRLRLSTHTLSSDVDCKHTIICNSRTLLILHVMYFKWKKERIKWEKILKITKSLQIFLYIRFVGSISFVGQCINGMAIALLSYNYWYDISRMIAITICRLHLLLCFDMNLIDNDD